MTTREAERLVRHALKRGVTPPNVFWLGGAGQPTRACSYPQTPGLAQDNYKWAKEEIDDAAERPWCLSCPDWGGPMMGCWITERERREAVRTKVGDGIYIIDDIVDEKREMSPAQIQSVHQWWARVFGDMG